jgi:hypothetical protein
VKHFAAALPKSPAMFTQQPWQVISLFQELNRTEELIQILDRIDLKAIGQSWALMNLVQTLLQNEKTRSDGLRLFRRAWEALPGERLSLVTQLTDDSVWQLPETYGYLHQAVIPGEAEKHIDPWAVANQTVYGPGADGRFTGVLTRLLEVATRQNQLETLTRDVEQALRRFPEWKSGLVLRAVLQARHGQFPAARQSVQQLLEDDKDPLTLSARWSLGQELENYGRLQELVVRLYDGAVQDALVAPSQTAFGETPARRLIALHQQAGRSEDARALALRFVGRELSYQYGNAYTANRRLGELAALGDLLLQLDCPVEAVRVYTEILRDPVRLQSASNFGNNPEQQALRERERALRGLKPELLARPLRDLLAVKDQPGEPEAAVDLAVFLHPTDFMRAALTSALAEALRLTAGRADLQAQVKGQVQALLQRHRRDLSVHVVAALATIAEGKPDSITAATARLLQLCEEKPLEKLAPGARPTTRQQKEAARQIVLWLVARECLRRPVHRSTGEKLAVRAVEAAARQTDPVQALALLREWGQIALDAGDRPGALRHWGEMLDLVLQTRAGAKSARAAVPVVTLDQFGQAMQIAHLAAEQELHALALRAVRATLHNGPPMQFAPQGRSVALVDQAAIFQVVSERLEELDQAWKQRETPAADVYEALAGVVMPRGRPGEVFLYPRPLQAADARQPRSVGKILAFWSVQARREADLRGRLEPYLRQASAELSARLLFAQLALAGNDAAQTTAFLEWLAPRLAKDKLHHSAELACHVAVPALEVAATARYALPVVEQATEALARQATDEGLVSSLAVILARQHFAGGQAKQGRKWLLNSLRSGERSNLASNGGDVLLARKTQLYATAAEFAHAGQLADALDLLGQFADAALPSQGDPPPGNLAPWLGQALATRPAPERYALLKAWTLPTAQRKSVRLWAGFAPVDIPLPAVFADAARTTAAHGLPNDMGVFSSAALLIEAAREAGQLGNLAAAAQKVAEEKIENGPVLFWLVQIARGQRQAVAPQIRQFLAGRPRTLPVGETPKPIQWSEYVLTRACLADARLRDLGVDAAKQLSADAQQLAAAQSFLSHLRRDLGMARVARAGARIAPAQDPGLRLWHPAQPADLGTPPSGPPRAWWVAHSGHISHLAGPDADFLYFDYPLTGTFEFSVEALGGAWQMGHVSYGGRVFEPGEAGSPSPDGVVALTGQVADVTGQDAVQRSCAFLRHDDYNRLTVQVTPSKVRYLVNGHLYYEDTDRGPTSPWLALFARTDQQTTFRNLTLRGSPEIPRTVHLSHTDRLDGWTSSGQTLPPRRSIGQTINGAPVTLDPQPDAYDWSARDGVLVGRRNEASTAPGRQSQLIYHRPLREGETVRYEFYYEPGIRMVHPSLNDLVFLLEPGGVRLHLVTEEDDPRSLKPDNVADEPAHRRGPRELPLKPRAWNAVQLTLKGAAVVLELNGVVVCERPLEATNDRRFGLFHYQDRTTAQARNVVLTGPWPETLGGPQRTDLAALLPADPAECRARADLIGEVRFSLDAADVVGRARGRPAAQRFTDLADWVLPSADHASFRLYAGFASTAVGRPGGTIEAPALELVAAAKEIGKLDELAERVRQAPAAKPDRRAQVALLALIRTAQGREDEAESLLKQLQTLAAKLAPDLPRWQRWPEVVAAADALHHPRLRPAALALLDHLITDCIQKLPADTPETVWEAHVRHLRGRAQALSRAEPLDPVPALASWSLVTHGRADTYGQGGPDPVWSARTGELMHYPGQGDDWLYFRVPLRGNFTIEGELAVSGGRTAQLAYGGLRIGLTPDRKDIVLAQHGRQLRKGLLTPALEGIPAEGWFAYRLSVQDGVCRAFLNGRKVYEQWLPPEPDPWLAVYAPGALTGDVRRLRLTGRPTVPDTLSLSNHADFTGWLTDYYAGPPTPTGSATGGTWERRGEELVGPAVRDVAGTYQEDVLRYHRPLWEDGEIEYEFFYEPGKALTHPALDRLVFLLAPDGIQIHRLTDGAYERTGLAPDNRTAEPEHRRGPARLPLQERAWNRLKLALAGEVVTLWLNGVEVYCRPLESGNRRVFGLFHYVDQTEVRVREVHYRGRWPSQVPAGGTLFVQR